MSLNTEEASPRSEPETAPLPDAVVTARPYTPGMSGETLSRMSAESDEGETIIAWDRDRRAFFRLDTLRERVYYETDADRFDENGRMLPTTEG